MIEEMDMPNKNVNKATAEQTFEAALDRLEKLVAEMESGDLPLDDSMKKFEEGMKLAKFCTGKLSETEKKIEILLRDSNGEPEWQEFDRPAAGSAPEEFDFG